MTKKSFDCIILGMGVAGVFCAHRIALKHKKMKILGIDIGRPPQKRKLQMTGWFSLFPSGDGKLYQRDVEKITTLTNKRSVKSALAWFNQTLSQVGEFQVIQDHKPFASIEKKLDKFGYQYFTNDYIQMFPKEIHILSKYMADIVEFNPNISLSFDNEILNITKQKNTFTVITEQGQYRCQKLIVAVGRSGWRWANELYNNLGLIENNDIARFGIRVEANSNIMKDFNNSNCSIFKNDNTIEIGPLCHAGTVIPEDHIESAISAFRSNEERWKTDKVSFNLIGNRPFPGTGFEQTDRLSKLTFLLANDRVAKERISLLLKSKSIISIIPEYSWLKEAILDFANIVPEITTKAYFHVPTIIPMTAKIKVNRNLETNIKNMFVVGESAGVVGLLSAALSGIICGDMVCK